MSLLNLGISLLIVIAIVIALHRAENKLRMAIGFAIGIGIGFGIGIGIAIAASEFQFGGCAFGSHTIEAGEAAAKSGQRSTKEQKQRSIRSHAIQFDWIRGAATPP